MTSLSPRPQNIQSVLRATVPVDSGLTIAGGDHCS
jgi:hypothetical protein